MKKAFFLHQSGATLIEILVSMIILSLGLLGYAGLILKSQGFNTTAHFRSQATILANGIIESARANKVNLASYVCASPCDPDNQSGSTTASSDLKIFGSDVEALPGGFSSISIGVDNKMAVSITWNNTDNTTSNFVTETWIK